MRMIRARHMGGLCFRDLDETSLVLRRAYQEFPQQPNTANGKRQLLLFNKILVYRIRVWIVSRVGLWTLRSNALNKLDVWGLKSKNISKLRYYDEHQYAEHCQYVCLIDLC